MMKIFPYGENSIRIVFGNTIDLDVHRQVRKCFEFLAGENYAYIIDIIPAFCSCVVVFDDESISAEEISAFLLEKQQIMLAASLPDPILHDIPVRYGDEWGPDLDFVCMHTGFSRDEVIARHMDSIYTVFAVGFIPGFSYLGPLDQRLYVPRLKTPRVKVPAGSVGIALNQTGVYPFDSPGGWQLIGWTGIKLFDKGQPPFSLLKMGDRVRFLRE